MSRSTSTGSNFKRSSLARSYALFCGNKLFKEQKACSKASYVATVEEKIKSAQKRFKVDFFDQHSVEDEASHTTSVEQGRAEANKDMDTTGATGSDPQNGDIYDSQDSELSASSEAAKKIRQVAESLTDPELMWTLYFSGMLDNCIDAVEENLVEGDVDLVSSIEVKLGKKRMEHRSANVCSLPIKLILTPLHRGRALAKAFASHLEMQFGPLHASLQVGQVVLEWNDSSLVAPYACNYQDGIFRVNLEKHSRWINCVTPHQQHFESAAAHLNLAGQTEQIFVIASKKKEMIDSLIDVIVKYNRFYFYNLIERNCQHFVMDCLTALGVELPSEFTGGLRDYYKKLVAGRTPKIPKEFQTHQDLDRYVESQDLQSMSQHDLEFIMVVYFHFHLKSKEKLREDRKLLGEWVCEEPSCRMSDVEEQVEHKSLLIHKFPPIN